MLDLSLCQTCAMSDVPPQAPISPPETPQAASPRGWYQDSRDPSRDRWWDGTAWTTYVHRSATLRRSMFGPGYARAWWAGPNLAAGRSLLFARISIGLVVLAVIVAAIFVASAHGESTSSVSYAKPGAEVFRDSVSSSIQGKHDAGHRIGDESAHGSRK